MSKKRLGWCILYVATLVVSFFLVSQVKQWEVGGKLVKLLCMVISVNIFLRMMKS